MPVGWGLSMVYVSGLLPETGMRQRPAVYRRCMLAPCHLLMAFIGGQMPVATTCLQPAPYRWHTSDLLLVAGACQHPASCHWQLLAHAGSLPELAITCLVSLSGARRWPAAYC